MNSSTFNETNATSEIVQGLDLARDIIINYGSRGISIVGICVNLFGLKVLQDKRLEEKFYDCLFCRCFCNLIVCLFGSLHHRAPDIGSQVNYVLGCLQVYLYFPSSRIAFIASIVCDVLLIFNRLLLLFNKKDCWFCTLSKKVVFILMLHVAINYIKFYFL